MGQVDGTQRFSSRVSHSLRYRPSYPHQVVETLERDCGLTRQSVIADVASGTGIFTRLLLEHGNRVFGVEPNAQMRQAGEKYLAPYAGFTSINGTAEATSLAAHSVDFVTAAQAAHWFDPTKSCKEFARILKRGGWLVLVWNDRRSETTPFLRQYEELLLRYGTDYQEVRHERTTSSIADFFAAFSFRQQHFPFRQLLDYAGIEGRLMSSSYAPGPEDPRHGPMLRELRRIFELHQKKGQVTVEYLTRMYYGRPG
jgi:SAM-dependent methyltransferase